ISRQSIRTELEALGNRRHRADRAIARHRRSHYGFAERILEILPSIEVRQCPPGETLLEERTPQRLEEVGDGRQIRGPGQAEDDVAVVGGSHRRWIRVAHGSMDTIESCGCHGGPGSRRASSASRQRAADVRNPRMFAREISPRATMAMPYAAAPP